MEIEITDEMIDIGAKAICLNAAIALEATFDEVWKSSSEQFKKEAEIVLMSVFCFREIIFKDNV